jgi:hypothetical protein
LNLILFSIFSPTGPNHLHSEIDQYNNHHYSISSKIPLLARKTNEENLITNNENEQANVSVSPSSSSKVKWMGAVRTVTQLNQVREKETNVD